MLLKKFEQIEKIKEGYLVRGDTANIKLVFLTDDVIRIRVSFAKTFPEESYTLVTTAWEDRMDELLKEERRRIVPLDIACMEEADRIWFETKTLRLVMKKEPLAFSLYTKDGTVIYRDLAERAYERDHLGRIAHYTCIDPKKEHFYGFGETSGELDKMGRRMRMSPKDAIGHDPAMAEALYKHIPFYIRIHETTLHAVGLFYHNSYDAVFDMGNEISGYWERYAYYQADGGDIDLFVINGPRTEEVLERYTLLTGRMAMPTKQSLGYNASTMYYAELDSDCDKRILEVIDQHFKERMYVDNFQLASGYSAGEEDRLRYVFHWNRKRFPEPEKFLQEMERKGVNVIPNLKPGILKRHPYRKKFEEADAFLKTPDGKEPYVGRWWGGAGRFLDFTNPSARKVWQELLKEQILRKGVKTIWNDNCEYDGVEDREAKCDFEGGTGDMARLKILQSNLMAFAGKQAFAEVYPQERPYQINRAGFAGIQRYAQVWGGDNRTSWETVKYNIAEILGMGLSGLANTGCDIGGFAGGAPEAELLLRWIQNGIFQPRFCLNSANDDNTVTQPWMYQEINEQVRAAFALRCRMIPYLYSLMREAHLNGKPLMRPLFFEFPEDVACYSDKHMTFLLGSSLLVANVVEKGAKVREVYLPAGCTWYELGNRLAPYRGGQTIEIPVTLDSIPMFLRGDGILAASEDLRRIASDQVRNLTLLISDEKDCGFTYYEDDGHSREYEKGGFSQVEIRVCAGEKCVIRFQKTGKAELPLEHITLELVSKEKGAYWVEADGRRIPEFMLEPQWEQAEEGWYYRMSDRVIRVKFRWPKKERFEVVISREKFDLIGMNEE
ncbi:MAG: glycoside hydrolase family 31 protein [Eubacteriales bacterium]|nr:glycoside hydrolase family 31 protein [Eubacteriales bacterium]